MIIKIKTRRINLGAQNCFVGNEQDDIIKVLDLDISKDVLCFFGLEKASLENIFLEVYNFNLGKFERLVEIGDLRKAFNINKFKLLID